MAQTVFNRYEKKYLMPEDVYHELRDRLSSHMHVDEYGLTTVCNIYYDTADNYLVRRSIEKPKYKEKLRLRSYGIPTLDSTVFLEIKKKYQGVVNKRRIMLTLREAYEYLENDVHPENDSQILREIDYMLQRLPLKRGLYLAYDRVALVGNEDSEFRVTFDKNIRSRRTLMGLENGDFGEYLLPEGYHLMESKIMGATPLWFAGILADLAIFPISFSKYGNIYKKEHDFFDIDKLMVHHKENMNEIRRKKIC